MADFPGSWGSASDVLGALGTIGAFAVALWLLKREGDDRRRDGERLRGMEERSEAERRRAQASLVTAWCEQVTPRKHQTGSLMITYRVAIRNGSSSAIYSHSALISNDFPNPGWSVGGGGELWRALPPGQTDYHEMSLLPRGDSAPYPPPIELMFTDAAGRPWIRHPDGTLEEQPLHTNEMNSIRLFEPPGSQAED